MMNKQLLTQDMMKTFDFDKQEAQQLSHFFSLKNAPISYTQAVAAAAEAQADDVMCGEDTASDDLDGLDLLDAVVAAIQNSAAWQQLQRQTPSLADMILDVQADEIELIDLNEEYDEHTYPIVFHQVQQWLKTQFGLDVHPYYALAYEIDNA